jgi:excisionase family DNA binding protein
MSHRSIWTEVTARRQSLFSHWRRPVHNKIGNITALPSCVSHTRCKKHCAIRTRTMRLITVREAATILRVSTGRVYELVRLGILPAIHLGRQIRIDHERLEAFINSGGQALPGGWRSESP